MRNAMVCPDCHTYMKVDVLGVYVLETMSNPPLPYKLWAADLMGCETCGKKVLARFGDKPIAEHFEPDFKDRLKTYTPMYYADERAGLRKA